MRVVGAVRPLHPWINATALMPPGGPLRATAFYGVPHVANAVRASPRSQAWAGSES